MNKVIFYIDRTIALLIIFNRSAKNDPESKKWLGWNHGHGIFKYLICFVLGHNKMILCLANIR